MREPLQPYIVTIDGPTASGKGTLVSKLAETLDFYPLHVGTLYRMAGYFALQNRGDFSGPSLLKIGQQVVDYKEGDALDLEQLKSEGAGSLAVRAAENIPLTKLFYAHFHRLCRQPPQNKKGIIFDADNSGKYIVPEAPVKIWLTADLEVRAERRWKQLQGQEQFGGIQDVSHIIFERDQTRSHRPYAPMEKAVDAIEIDSTELTVEGVYTRVLEIIAAHIPLSAAQR